MSNRGTLAIADDLETGRKVYVIPDDRTMSDYARHLVVNGHKPRVLGGFDVRGRQLQAQYNRKRWDLIHRMERRHAIKLGLCPDVPNSLTWAHHQWPVRVVFADSRAAVKAAAEVFLLTCPLKGEANKDLLANIRVLAWYFAKQMDIIKKVDPSMRDEAQKWARVTSQEREMSDRGALAIGDDPLTERKLFVMPDDYAMSGYARHLVTNGHKPGILNGAELAGDKNREMYGNKRRALRYKMEQEFQLKAMPCADAPQEFTWAYRQRPVRVMFATYETAARAAEALFEQTRWNRGGEWNDILQNIHVIVWYFAEQIRKNGAMDSREKREAEARESRRKEQNAKTAHAVKARENPGTAARLFLEKIARKWGLCKPQVDHPWRNT